MQLNETRGFIVSMLYGIIVYEMCVHLKLIKFFFIETSELMLFYLCGQSRF